jgi:hypothetical protein
MRVHEFERVALRVEEYSRRWDGSLITVDVYSQAVSEQKRAAQELAVRGLLGEGAFQHPSAPSEGRVVI